MTKRGQAGVEYIILIGVLLFFFIPIIYYSLTLSMTNVKMSQIENIINRLGKAVDAVYALGPGSMEIIPITMPEGVTAATVGGASGHEILLKVTGSGGLSDVHVSTKAYVMGSIPIEKGTYYMKVETSADGTVNLVKR